MSTIFWKNLLECFPTTTPTPHPLPLKQDCSQPSPPSSTTPTNSTAPSIMIRNFNSLYDLSSSCTSKSLGTLSTNSSSSFYDPDTGNDDSPPDLATIFASQRFFFSSPGRSNSIIESLDRPRTYNSHAPISGGIAVKKYSPDPYKDFKLSMQEMIEARELKDVRANWDHLHELFSCYLTLNPKHIHKYIISAFVDIVVRLLSASSSPESGNHWQSNDRRRHDVPGG